MKPAPLKDKRDPWFHGYPHSDVVAAVAFLKRNIIENWLKGRDGDIKFLKSMIDKAFPDVMENDDT